MQVSVRALRSQRCGPGIVVLGLFWMLAWPGGADPLRAQTPARPLAQAVEPVSVQPLEQPDLPPVTPPAQDPPAQETEPPAIPETIVAARAQPFPSAPLGENSVLSATRTVNSAAEVGSSVTVITRQELENQGQATVAEVLRTVTGVDVARQGNVGGLTSVFIRGGNSNHTKVLLDGIPLNDPSGAGRAFDFSLMTVDGIERIEVLRGPQSVLYGSDAIGGVVNIVTRRGEGPAQWQFGTLGGSYGTHRESLAVSGGNERVYYSVAGSYWETTGFSAADRRNGNQEADGYRNATFSSRLGWNPTPWSNLDCVVRIVDAETQVDNFDFATGLPVDNLIRANPVRAIHQRVQWQSAIWEGLLDQRIGFSLSDYRRRDTDPEMFVPEQFRGQTRELDWQADAILTESNVFTAGAVYYHEEADTTFQPQLAQYQVSAYVQDQWQWRNVWFASVGFRWDDHNRAGTARTYRFTNRIVLASIGAAVHGSLGTGFRAPALAENLFQFGNPDLRPERSKGWDVGWEQSFGNGNLVVDATYFRNDFEDLIVFDFDTFALANVGQARSHGVELAANWQFNPAWLLAANYTYDDTLDVEQQQPLLRRPRNKCLVALERSWDQGRAVMRLESLFVGERLDTRQVRLAPYTLMNASARYAWSPHWTLHARLDNLLNQDYEEINGYGVAAFSGYAGLDFLW